MIKVIFNNDGIIKKYNGFDEITCLENYNDILILIVGVVI
jgi:hypothetical protein